MALADPPLDAQQHVARHGEHDEGDAEQDKTEGDQCRGVEVIYRLGELVGDGRRYGGAGREYRRRYAVRVADHEGYRHGLAERAPEPQHDAADDPDSRERQHDVAHHFPGSAADPIGGLLQHRRHGFEHLPRDRGDERQHHDGQDQARREHADAVGRSREQSRQPRNVAEYVDQERLQRLLQERREHEQAPYSVDDARDPRQHLDSDRDGTPQPQRAELGQEDRDQETDRHRDQHRQERGHDRAVDRRQRTELLRDR